MTTYFEPARDIPIVEECDVVVCGGGPAGVAAAIAAARTGARTRLLEMQGCLGGTWTAGLVSWIIESRKTGLMHQITQELDRRGARGPGGERDFAYDPESMKLLLDELVLEAGVQVQLYTHVVGTHVNDAGRLALALTESKSGRQAWAAKAFIDTTGDGDLAAQAGCGFDLGHPETGQLQPMSLITLVTLENREALWPYVCNQADTHKDAKKRLFDAMTSGGVSPSYAAPVLFHVRDNLYSLSANHEYGVSGLSAADLTGATLRGRAEMNRLVAALRSLGGPWEGMRLVATAAHIGVREGRRVHGLYTINTDDMLQGAAFEDAVCRVTVGIDVHSPDPSKSKTFAPENSLRTKPYDIPLRSLIARDVQGLLMAGRCVSGDFLAHSSYRMTGTAVAMGQAAGTVAALAAQQHCLPQEVPWADVQAALHRQGAL